MTEDTFEGAGGLNIFYRAWRPTDPPHAMMVIVHGFNSHSGYYKWVGTRLAAKGLATYAFDLRGRGRSDGERFYVDAFDDYVGDLAGMIDVAKAREGDDCPVFVLGHSAGGVIACVYALEHQDELAGLVCESFAYKVPAPSFALAVVKGISHLAPHAHVLRLKNENFSRDPNVVIAMNDDPLIADEVQPTKTVAEMVRADNRLKKEIEKLTLPLLILHGTDDSITEPSGSEYFYERSRSKDKTLKFYEGHYHDLLNDRDKEAVMSDIAAWLAERVPVA